MMRNILKKQRKTETPVVETEDVLPEISAEGPAEVADATPKRSHKARLVLWSTRKRKILAISGAVVLVIVALLIIPFTRYAIFGQVVKKNITVTVTDSQTKKPVSGAQVKLGSMTAVADKDGKAVLRKVPVGDYSLEVTKNYYVTQKQSFNVSLFAKPKSPSIIAVANGRLVTFMVTDKVSAKPLANAKLTIGTTTATTDQKGEAIIVLSPSKNVQTGKLELAGYNSTGATITLDGDTAKNTNSMVAAGSIVYLSNATGKIGVMRANLDGTGATNLLAGTGSEDRYDTSLLSSRDWKFSVLKSKRESGVVSLNLVNTTTGEVKNIDEGNITFTLVGWSGHKFIYTVNRGYSAWSDKNAAMKMYDADVDKLTTLDETYGTGTYSGDSQYQYYGEVYLLNNEIVFGKLWGLGGEFTFGRGNGQSSLLIAIDTTTLKKRTIKEFSQHQTYGVISLGFYEPQGIYVFYSDNGATAYYEYEDGALKTVGKPDTNDQYPTYLTSPSGNKTFWYEQRDGKNTIFIGDKEGKNAKQIASLSEYVPYGWYGDNDQYILFTKSGSELYIAPADTINGSPLKVTDYYKVQTYPGYGNGYGGQ